MKLLLNTEDFCDLEFKSLLSCIKEFNDLKEMVNDVENDERYGELEITISMDGKKCYGYWCSHRIPKQLLLDLLHETVKVYDRDIKSLLEATGLTEVKDDE